MIGGRLVDDEPPDHSIVVDRDDDAWKRYGTIWGVTGEELWYSWPELTERFGPIFLVRNGNDSHLTEKD